MNLRSTARVLALGAMLVCAAVCVTAAQAQRGPGGGGPPGGGMGPPGGGMGGGMGERGRMDMPLRTAPVPRVGLQLGPPLRWWDDKHTIKALKLRNDQQKRMDDIYETNKGALLNLYGNLQREESRLSSMSREDLQDESKVFAAIDRVAAARTDLEKEYAHIQLAIRKELDAGQVAELDREMANGSE